MCIEVLVRWPVREGRPIFFERKEMRDETSDVAMSDMRHAT